MERNENLSFSMGEIEGRIGYEGDRYDGAHKFILGYRENNPSNLVFSSYAITQPDLEPSHENIGKLSRLYKVLGGGFTCLSDLRQGDKGNGVLRFYSESSRYGGVPKKVMEQLVEEIGEEIIKHYNENSQEELRSIWNCVKEPDARN